MPPRSVQIFRFASPGARPSFKANGQIVKPLAEIPCLALVLVNPGLPLKTRDVFNAMGNADNPPLGTPPTPLRASTLIPWLRMKRNDLESAARSLQPQIGEVLNRLRRAPECKLARMTGSGATCFGVFENLAAARVAANEIVAEKQDWWAVATVTRTGAEPDLSSGETEKNTSTLN